MTTPADNEGASVGPI